ncbi:MAG: hypothetical protein NC402_00665 [Prevotella sp.]|nr:hypothetical protein [Prevotella sp.]MCM1074715.1 hypothetical protein [Ruminococcus sp.]
MSVIIFFIFTSIFLLSAEIGYILLARKYIRCANRNGYPAVVIGGGIIFYIAMLIWYLTSLNCTSTGSGTNFIIGLTLVAACSFADDLVQLTVWFRLIVQFVAVAFLGLQCGIFDLHPIIWPIFMVCTVGFVNAYNFMDGINGITAVYSLSVLGTFLYIDICQVNFVPASMIVMAVIAVTVFALFNYRRKAIVFAGDVGSISMGFIVATLLIYYIIETHRLTSIVLVGVYGVDTLLTVLLRIYKGETIFKPHHKHLYQRLNNELKYSQLRIVNGYAMLQLAISIGYIQMETSSGRIAYSLIVMTFLIGLYFLLCSRCLKNGAKGVSK